jgi:hypothetical protein
MISLVEKIIDSPHMPPVAAFLNLAVLGFLSEGVERVRIRHLSHSNLLQFKDDMKKAISETMTAKSTSDAMKKALKDALSIHSSFSQLESRQKAHIYRGKFYMSGSKDHIV